MSQIFLPLIILKYPAKPQDCPQVFEIIQKGVPFSSPQPTIFPECPPTNFEPSLGPV